MSGRRLVALALLSLGLPACGPGKSTLAPIPIAPEDGPRASISVSYSGGLIDRSVDVFYSTDRNAYVVVGHLGGDGVISILHPSDARERALVSGKKSQSLRFNAPYDGAPSLFSYAVSPFRSIGALTDSYDGRGHGYVFIIASDTPFDFRRISYGLEFDVIEVEDYQESSDPRLAIYRFAQGIVGWRMNCSYCAALPKPFTLKFANNFTTRARTSYGVRAWDCSLLAGLGLGYSSYWNLWDYGLAGRHGLESRCGHAGRYAYYDHRTNWYFGSPITPHTPVATNPKVPTPRPPTTRPLRPWDRRKDESGRSADVARGPQRNGASPATRSASRGFPDAGTRGRGTVTSSDRDGSTRPSRTWDSHPSGAASERSASSPQTRTSSPSSPGSPSGTHARETTPRSEPATRSEPARSESPRRDPPSP